MQGDLLKMINEALPSLSKGHRLCALYILENYGRAAYMTAAQLGHEVGVSESTVVRFAAELGFDGYPELHSAMREALSAHLTSVERIMVTNDRITDDELLKAVLASDAEKIKNTLENIDRAAFDRAVAALLEARSIYIIGMRSSSALAEFINYYLSIIFENVRLVRTTSGSEIFEQLMRIGQGDVLLAVSFPRYSTRIVNAVEYACDAGAKVVSITDSVHSPIWQPAYAALTARSDMASFVDSLVAPLSIINALIVAIGKKKQPEISEIFERLETVWDEYNVYNK